MPIHEFITFKPTEAVLADPTTTLAPAAKFFSTAEGCSGLYYGPSEEDKNVAFIVIAWESYEHHKAIIDAPGYPGIVGLANAIVDNSSTMLHVHFREPPEPAFGAPVTEVAVTTTKPGKTVAEFDAAIEAMVPLVGAEDGCLEGTWGVTKEDSSKSVLFRGWVSVQRHFEIVGQDKYKPLVAPLVETVDIVFHHASFKKYA